MKRHIRLLAIGDCNTSGVFSASQSHSIPQSVCEHLIAAGYSVELQNLGNTMSTSREGIMRAKLQARSADVLLLNFGLVDAWKTSIPQIYIPYYPDNFFRKFWRKLLKLIKKRLRKPLIRRLIPYGYVVSLLEYESNIKLIIDSVRRISPDLHVICWGSPPTCNDISRNVSLVEFDHALEKAVSGCGSFIHTRSILENHPKEDMYLDEVHLSQKGCDIIAISIVAVLKQQVN